MADGAWTAAASSRLNLRLPLQRNDRDFRRAVDAHGNVDRSDAAADEHPRVLARREAFEHRKAAPRDRADAGQHDLATVRVAGENRRHVELRGCIESPRIVREEQHRVTRALDHARNLRRLARPEPDAGQLARLTADLEARARVL